jgi:hypothetical protein
VLSFAVRESVDVEVIVVPDDKETTVTMPPPRESQDTGAKTPATQTAGPADDEQISIIWIRKSANQDDSRETK